MSSLLFILMMSCTSNNDIDISKYPIITTVAELSEFYDLNLDTTGQYEQSTITKYFDGSLALEYSYDLLESDTFDPLFYSITVEQERTPRDAREVFILGKNALNIVGNSFGQGTIKIDSLDLPGDDTYYALRTYDGQPNGMFYIVRKGARVYTMMASGIYTTDHSIVYDIIIPKIEDLETYNITK